MISSSEISRRDTMPSPIAVSPLLIACFIPFGLTIDQFGGTWGQASVSVMTWLLFALLVARSAPSERLPLIACLLFATLGEVVLALVWGLYDYRQGNLPLFVPPGHVLLYALGLAVAPRMPRFAPFVTAMLAIVVAVLLAVTHRDMLSAPLVMLFVLCIAFGPSPKLYSSMFVLALAMEIIGTWIGNWTWAPQAPGLGLVTLNPPFAAGAFYCVLDWLVGLVRSGASGGRRAGAAAA
jgi:hypothetical protein